jgi:hypothetical protein
LFAAFPWRSLALYWTLRYLSVEGFHVSVSIPLSIPRNFLECTLSVSWSPRPPWAGEGHHQQKQETFYLQTETITLNLP